MGKINLRVIQKDMKHGKIKLCVETLDDLWHLQHLVRSGDIVTSLTWRREQEPDNKLRPERLKKKRVTLSVKVEGIEFHKYANRLRILGAIVHGPDIGKHHSFSYEPGSVLSVSKEWKPDELHRIREAVQASRRPRVLLVSLDDTSADLAIVRQYGLDEFGTISRSKMGKMYSVEIDAEEKKFFYKLADAMNDIISRENIRTAIVAGPGFTKEAFAEFMREKFPDLSAGVRLGDASSGGRAGLYEIVRRGMVEKISRDDHLSLETSLIDQVMREIAQGELATYGHKEIRHAASVGAIGKLLVADVLLRSNRADIEHLLEEARKIRAEVVIISTEHDAGKQLLALGGLAALLRFRIS